MGSPRIQDRPTMQIVCETLAEERLNLVQLGVPTNTASSSTATVAATTSYVTSCTFESFSDHNPVIKKKMKMRERIIGTLPPSRAVRTTTSTAAVTGCDLLPSAAPYDLRKLHKYKQTK